MVKEFAPIERRTLLAPLLQFQIRLARFCVGRSDRPCHTRRGGDNNHKGVTVTEGGCRAMRYLITNFKRSLSTTGAVRCRCSSEVLGSPCPIKTTVGFKTFRGHIRLATGTASTKSPRFGSILLAFLSRIL